MQLVKHNWAKGKILQFENRPVSLNALVCRDDAFLSDLKQEQSTNHLKRNRKIKGEAIL